MKLHFARIAIVFLSGVFCNHALARPAEDEKPMYIGEVIIVGNTITQDRVIREQLGFFPGQVLRYPERHIAKRDLARLGIFKVDPGNGIRPTVRVIESPGPFKDILVTVEEANTGMVHIGAGVNSDGGLLLRLLFEERNGDLRRWPTSMADFKDGRAFRGAAQLVRFEVTWSKYGMATRFGRQAPR